MTTRLTDKEVATIIALAKANNLDADFIRSTLQAATCSHYGNDGSFRICYGHFPLVPKLIVLPVMATSLHRTLDSTDAKTYIALWVGEDPPVPFELECFRIDGTDPSGLPELGELAFSSYYEEFGPNGAK